MNNMKLLKAALRATTEASGRAEAYAQWVQDVADDPVEGQPAEWWAARAAAAWGVSQAACAARESAAQALEEARQWTAQASA